LVVVGDSGFAALDLLAALARRGVVCVTRLRLDAALYEPAPPRKPRAVGRPRTKGARLSNLTEVLTDAATEWRRITVPGWYGGGERVVEVCSNAAVWRHAGMPVVPIPGCSSETLRAAAIRRPYSAPILPATLSRSSSGSPPA